LGVPAGKRVFYAIGAVGYTYNKVASLSSHK